MSSYDEKMLKEDTNRIKSSAGKDSTVLHKNLKMGCVSVQSRI